MVIPGAVLVAPNAPNAGGAAAPKAEVDVVGAAPAKPKAGGADDVAVPAPKPPNALSKDLISLMLG